MITIETMPEFPVEKEEQLDPRSLAEPPAEKETVEASIQIFVISLFQIADQAKIIHLQTDYDTEHRHFGMFYDTFTGQLDSLIEGIAGKYGKDKIKFGQASVSLYDYETALPIFFATFDKVMLEVFGSIFSRDKDSELFNMVDEMITLKNKVQYLLQMK